MKKSKPYIQGEKDFKAGKGWIKNPYKYGGKAHYEWESAMIDCYNKCCDEIRNKHNFKEKY